MIDPLLPPSLLPRLERLSITSRRRVRGTMQGKRRSSRFGSSLEFADYREYAPGDDIRRFDWSVYSRTGRPFVRQYWDEQELQVSLFVDISASMDFGGKLEASTGAKPPTENKLLYAKRLAAAIGYMALASEDMVQAVVFSEELKGRLPLIRGKASAFRLFSFLQEAVPAGKGDLAMALRKPEALPRKPGMTWIFSDLWFERGAEGIAETLSFFQAAGQEIVLVHVLSEAELRPTFSGDLRLLDSELGTGKEIGLTGKILEQYGRALDEYIKEIGSYCGNRGIRYVLAPANVPLEQGIVDILHKAGAVSS